MQFTLFAQIKHRGYAVESVHVCVRSPVSKYSDFQKAGFWNNRPLAIVDFRSIGREVTIRFQIQIRASRQTFWVARVFFLMWLCGAQSGRRAR